MKNRTSYCEQVAVSRIACHSWPSYLPHSILLSCPIAYQKKLKIPMDPVPFELIVAVPVARVCHSH